MRKPIILALLTFAVSTLAAQKPITIASLRTLATPSTTTPYFITDAGRQGLFYYDAKDLLSKDNGGTVIVNKTKRFKRMYSGAIDVRWFGMKGDWNGSSGSDNTAAFLAAINAATSTGINQTNIGAGLTLATSLFDKIENSGSRAIILLSDGAGTYGADGAMATPTAAARRASLLDRSI